MLWFVTVASACPAIWSVVVPSGAIVWWMMYSFIVVNVTTAVKPSQ